MARLTIPNEQTYASFEVPTSTTDFAITFSLFAKADLTVLVDGVELEQSDFTFSGTLLEDGGYDGGTVTLNTAVDDVTVRIERNVTPVRASNFAPANAVPVRTVDQSLNRLTAVQQDHSRRVGDVETALDDFSGTVGVPDGSVTNAKLANMAQATIKGRASGAGTGAPGDLTAAQAATIVRSELIENAITNGETSKSPTSDAVFDALALKANSASLGDAATKNVGTTAGTVAAGDDSRIVGAAQVGLIIASPEVYGGRTSTDVQSAIDARYVTNLIPSPTSYSITGITISDHKGVQGNNAVLAAQTSGPIFTMSGFCPLVRDVYVSGYSDASNDYMVSVNGTYRARIDGLTAVNVSGFGVRIHNDAADASGNRSGSMRDVKLQGVTKTAFYIDTAVNKWTFSNVEGFGKINYAGPGATNGKPEDNSVGWRINPANKTLAVGGHQFVNCRAEALDYGWHLSGTELLMLSNCFADGCSNYGLRIDGASNDIDIDHFFAGTTRGIYVGGTSDRIYFRALTTVFTGTIPPWGSSDFFDGVSTFYDITVADTAVVTIEGDSWRGTKRASVASGAKLIVTGGQRVGGDSEVLVAGGSTVYIKSGGGTTATEADATFRAEFDGVLFMLQADSDDTPASGQNHIYTVRVNGADTALTCTTAAAAFQSRAYHGGVTVNRGDSVSIKLETAGGASPAARHDAFLQLLQA